MKVLTFNNKPVKLESLFYDIQITENPIMFNVNDTKADIEKSMIGKFSDYIPIECQNNLKNNLAKCEFKNVHY